MAIKVDKQSKAKDKEKDENNELMEYTLLCTGMTVKEKTLKYFGYYGKKNSENRR